MATLKQSIASNARETGPLEFGVFLFQSPSRSVCVERDTFTG
jgi:hypothetical protein